MSGTYQLSNLDPNTFEHLVNMLALRVLGLGHTSFGPGSDGGRDGYFEGEAPYPSTSERWSGIWFIQSKFHKPHLSKDPQKWLVERIREELKEFGDPNSKRKLPNNWIVATNIDPSGSPMTGSFDKARKLVAAKDPQLNNRFHIWGGRKILDLLNRYPEVADYYKHFLTPGRVLTALFEQITDRQAELKTIVHYLIVSQFDDQQYTRLEQAGSAADTRPGIHKLFIDLPFRVKEFEADGLVMDQLTRSAAKNHRLDVMEPSTPEWRLWKRFPSRARVWFVKGGPGQGKSTIGQYFCQIQRAALILEGKYLAVSERRKDLAKEIKQYAERGNLWPTVPRIPISIELKDFAQWFGRRKKEEPRGILTYLAQRVSAEVEQEVLVGTLKRALELRGWFFVFDGLDEVPTDVKDSVASIIRNFIEGNLIETDSDALVLCTSRPQGYSGQFSDLGGPTVNLVNLSREQSLQCAKPVLEIDRSMEEARKYFKILSSAIESPSVKELMTTPLQSHIMAIVVRGGGRPPERRWQLFRNFYEVIRSREANKDSPDPKLSRLLREDEQLLKTVHNRLGFVLHSRAETSQGAQTRLPKAEFRQLVMTAVSQMVEQEAVNVVDVLMNATTDRLVLVSTPDDGDHVRFDIRPLQEFFAAEFIYEYVESEELRSRIEVLAGDSHWREVMHFLLSALVESNRITDMSVANSVLQNLDEGDEDQQWVRMLRRRLGRGAILISRLLQEGVFEQDRRNRQQFRKTLEPMAGFIQFDALLPLMFVTQLNSRTWLINFLLDSLQEFDLTENMGAAVVLTQLLTDEEGAVDRVKTFVLSCPPNYVSFLLSTIASALHLREAVLSSQSWFLDLILQLQLRDQWRLLGPDGVGAATSILSNNKELTIQIANKRGLSELEKSLLEILIDRGQNSPDRLNYGLISGSHYKHDWGSGLPDAYRELNVTDVEARGVLGLVASVVRFAQTKQISDLAVILDRPDASVLSGLPLSVQAYLPMPMERGLSPQDKIEHLRRLTQHQFNNLLSDESKGILYRVPSGFALGTSCTEEQWEKLVRTWPEMALFVWDRRLDAWGDHALIYTDRGVEILAEGLTANPRALLRFPSVWGELFGKYPNSSELRNALLQAAVEEEPRRWGLSDTFTPFRLDLPREAAFLPHLLVAVLPDLQLTIHGNSDGKNRDLIARRIHELTGDNSVLEAIKVDRKQPKAIKAAAALMIQIADGSDGSSLDGQRLISFYEPGKMTWYLESLTNYLGISGGERIADIRFVVGSLLMMAREEYGDRQVINKLLNVWRETSQAPIQKAGVEARWLVGM